MNAVYLANLISLIGGSEKSSRAENYATSLYNEGKITEKQFEFMYNIICDAYGE